MFDRVKIFVKAGDGGDGSPHMRHEMYVPRGGPDGGDGGRGGSVYLEADHHFNTLVTFAHKKHFKAESGGRGSRQRSHGKAGDDTVLKVPPGTIVRTADSDDILADLVNPGDRIMAARGGRGGLGNTHFTTSTNQTPRFAQKGEPGDERWVRLELKLIADVGLVGLPNAGKSTLLSVISAAKPKIADYPFTTLEPQLGMVQREDVDFVVADIPGLIEGAHEGAGLGHEFLRHVERTRLLVHLVDGSGQAGDPLSAYRQIRSELSLYAERLAGVSEILAITKQDLPDAQDLWPLLQTEFRALGAEPLPISAVTHQGIDRLLDAIAARLPELPPTASFAPASSDYKVFALSPEDELRIVAEDDGFTVRGRKVERLIAMTDLSRPQAVDYLQTQLQRLGVTRALERAGVHTGDLVRIGSEELIWQ
ncbi:MAG TPA: GTPase ObgE [Chloroflexota bacterium]|nr:GTPase ObgE [Chloroflexota bacterium]